MEDYTPEPEIANSHTESTLVGAHFTSAHIANTDQFPIADFFTSETDNQEASDAFGQQEMYPPESLHLHRLDGATSLQNELRYEDSGSVPQKTNQWHYLPRNQNPRDMDSDQYDPNQACFQSAPESMRYMQTPRNAVSASQPQYGQADQGTTACYHEESHLSPVTHQLQRQQHIRPGHYHQAVQSSSQYSSLVPEPDARGNKRRGIEPLDEPDTDTEDDVPLMERQSFSPGMTNQTPPDRQRRRFTIKVRMPRPGTAGNDAAGEPAQLSEATSTVAKVSHIPKSTPSSAGTPSPAPSNDSLTNTDTDGSDDKDDNGDGNGDGDDGDDKRSEDKASEPEIRIDWKLPEYEALSDFNNKDLPAVKISVPGLVREEVLLCPDHPILSVTLFHNVFFPNHKRTYPSPAHDPEPRHSVLNFHTISKIVIGVFFTLREHLGSQFKLEEVDPDEVFFSAIDNWRVGLVCKREGYMTVRGVQEFCDVALDVIFYIKVHGLGADGDPAGKRRERRDKGVKRGPRVTKTHGQSNGKEAAPKRKANKTTAPRAAPKAKNALKKVKHSKVEKNKK